MPVLIRTIPSFPGYFSAGQSITVLRRIRGRYCFFYTGHIFVSRLLSWDLSLHGKFNKNNFFPSDKKWHTLAHIWNPVVKENPESSKYLWQLTRLWIRIKDSRPRESFFSKLWFSGLTATSADCVPCLQSGTCYREMKPRDGGAHHQLKLWSHTGNRSRNAIRLEYRVKTCYHRGGFRDNHQPIIRLKFWSQYIMLCSCYWWWLSFAFDYHGQI